MSEDCRVQISGEVSRILHYKEDSGWCVFILRMEDGKQTNVVGVFPDLVVGTALQIDGDYHKHPKFGNQYKATGFTLQMPTSDLGIRKYLEWALPQIGPHRAGELVREFGDDIFRVLDEECERVSIIDGITDKRALEIEEAWKKGEPRRKAYIYLARFGLTKKMVEQVIEYFKDDTVDIVEGDPYVLVEVSGLSFGKVDQVALSMGVAPNSQARRRAALTYLIRSSTRSGDVFLTVEQVCVGIKNLHLPMLDQSAWSQGEVQEHLNSLSESGFIVQDGEKVYLSKLYYAEVAVAHMLLEMVKTPVGSQHILRMVKPQQRTREIQGGLDRADHTIRKNTEKEQLRLLLKEDPDTWFEDPKGISEEDSLDAILDALEDSQPADLGVGERSTLQQVARKFRDAPEGRLFAEEDIERFLEVYQVDHDIEFSEAQRQAVHMANKSRIFLLTGLPGTGKTTVLKAILQLYLRASLSVQLCAPTGKAAKRLSTVAGRPASTIHRYLKGFQDSWCHCSGNPAPDHAVIVDEFSMVDINLMYHLMDALPPSKYLAMVGDPGQLPSVGPGSVLRDIIESDTVPRVHLEEIFRQAGTSMIVQNAHRIHHGEGIVSGDSDDFLCYWRDGTPYSLEYIKHISKAFIKRGIPFQIISPKRKDAAGTLALNELLKPILNPGSSWSPYVEWGDRKFHLSDKVIMTRNDYNKRVFNGDIGEVVHVDATSRSLSVAFEDNDLFEELEGNPRGPEVKGDGPRHVKFQGDDLNNLELAYALTVHKSQGSEWDTVVLLMLKSHGRMLRRRLFYTAVTRAKKRLLVVGENQAVSKAIANNTDDNRNTSLRELLQEPMGLLQERLSAYHANSVPPRPQLVAQA